MELRTTVNLWHGAGARKPSPWGRLCARYLCAAPPIKMCRDPRHTFIFHAPEGRASYAEGVLHVPQARFICGAPRRNNPSVFCPRGKKYNPRQNRGYN